VCPSYVPHEIGLDAVGSRAKAEVGVLVVDEVGGVPPAESQKDVTRDRNRSAHQPGHLEHLVRRGSDFVVRTALWPIEEVTNFARQVRHGPAVLLSSAVVVYQLRPGDAAVANGKVDESLKPVWLDLDIRVRKDVAVGDLDCCSDIVSSREADVSRKWNHRGA
jgi:hypothetical protein